MTPCNLLDTLHKTAVFLVTTAGMSHITCHILVFSAECAILCTLQVIVSFIAIQTATLMVCYRPIANVNNFSHVLRCLGKVIFGTPGIADVRAWPSVNIMYSAILCYVSKHVFRRIVRPSLRSK